MRNHDTIRHINRGSEGEYLTLHRDKWLPEFLFVNYNAFESQSWRAGDHEWWVDEFMETLLA